MFLVGAYQFDSVLETLQKGFLQCTHCHCNLYTHWEPCCHRMIKHLYTADKDFHNVSKNLSVFTDWKWTQTYTVQQPLTFIIHAFIIPWHYIKILCPKCTVLVDINLKGYWQFVCGSTSVQHCLSYCSLIEYLTSYCNLPLVSIACPGYTAVRVVVVSWDECM